MTKKLDIIIYILLAAIVVVFVIVLTSPKETTEPSNNEKTITDITLDKNNITIYIGDTSVLVASITPSDATNTKLIWRSTNPGVAGVNNGIVTGYSEGEAEIVVSSADKKIEESCYVSVLPREVEKVKLDIEKLSLKVGDKKTIHATVEPSYATYKNVIYRSSNESVITVDSTGTILAIGSGTAEIIVTDEKGVAEARCKVTVENRLEKIEIEPSMELTVGKEGKLNAILTPSDTTETSVTWKSSNTNVATVDNEGKVVAKKPGTATITVTGANNISASCKVTVQRAAILVREVKIDILSTSLYVGKTVTLKAKVVPTNADNQKIVWSSSDESIAKVDQTGVVTAKKAGTVTITATSVEGAKKASSKITVKAKSTALSPIVPTSGVMAKFESSTFKYYIQNNNRYYLTYIWMEDPYNQIRKLDPNTGVYGKIMTDDEMDSKGLTRYRKTIGDTMNDYIAKGIIPVDKAAIGFNGGGFYVSGYWTPPSQYYDKRSSSWIVVQNGVLTRNRINADDTPIDTIIGIAEGGILKSYGSGSGSPSVRENIYNAIKKDKVNNTWAFNPLLVGSGVDSSWWTQAYAQRNAICQINTNNYVMFSSANGSSHYFELQNIFKSIGCKTAMNLDGGGSTSFFVKNRGDTSVTKVKCGESNGRCREVIEGIYFTEK